MPKNEAIRHDDGRRVPGLRPGLIAGHARQRERAQSRRQVPCRQCQRPISVGLAEGAYSVTKACLLIKQGYCSIQCQLEARWRTARLPEGPLVTPKAEGVQCNICGKTFVHLSSHMGRQHGITGSRETGRMERLSLYGLRAGDRLASDEYRDQQRGRSAPPTTPYFDPSRMMEAFKELNAVYPLVHSQAQLASSRHNLEDPGVLQWNAYQQAMNRLTLRCQHCGDLIVTTYGRERGNGNPRMYCSKRCAAIVNQRKRHEERMAHAE